MIFIFFFRVSFTGSLESSTGGSLMKGLSGKDNFLGMLQIYLLNVSAISSSLDIATSLSIKFIVSL